MKRLFLIFPLVLISAIGLLLLGRFLFLGGKKPNVILIILDTLRADHLGVYGYNRQTSPNIDAFARENILFKYAITPAPWTPPAIASMFTGKYPLSHGMMPPPDREKAKAASAILASNQETLAEILKAHGYQTSAVTPNPWLSEDFGFNQGFDNYSFLLRAAAQSITDEALRLLENFQKAPFFLMVHYLDPHDPYAPPPPFSTMFKGPPPVDRKYSEDMIAKIELYDGEIRYLDTELGRLFKQLKVKNLYNDAIIVIVGDHGEQFLEQGKEGHGHNLFNTELHVPLMIRRRGERAEILTTTSSVDIFATVLEETGIAVPAGIPSVSLFDEVAERKRGGIFSEIRRRGFQRSFTNIDGKKLIIDYGSPDAANSGVAGEIRGMFQSREDLLELKPLSDPALQNELQLQLQEAVSAAIEIAGQHETTALPEERINQLKSLGYLH